MTLENTNTNQESHHHPKTGHQMPSYSH